MSDVFISYANEDRGLADQVCTYLEARGFICWIAPRDVSRGKSYPEEIVRAIKSSTATLLLLSASSNTSEHVRREIHAAFSHGASVFVIRIDKVVPSEFLEYYIASIQWVEAVGRPLEECLGELAITLKRTVHGLAQKSEEERRGGSVDSGDQSEKHSKFSNGFKLRKSLKGHSRVIIGVSWSPDGRFLASASRDKTVQVWDVEKRTKSICTLKGHTHPVTCAEWSPDGNKIASGSYDNCIKIWDVASGQQIRSLEEHDGTVWCVAWSRDGRILVSASEDSDIFFWDTERDESLCTLTDHTCSVNTVAWAPDKNVLASGSDDANIILWDAALGEPINTLRGHESDVWNVAWSPDGKTLASASPDETVRVWDISNAQELATLRGYSKAVNGVSFSADGRLLASKSRDGTVHIYRCTDWEELLVLDEPAGGYWARLAFHPVDATLATLGAHDQMIRIWDYDESLI